MSSDQDPMNETGRPPATRKPRRHPVLSVIMALIGIVLLLPGVCAIVFASMMGPMGQGMRGEIGMLWMLSIAISIAGIVLIVRAFR